MRGLIAFLLVGCVLLSHPIEVRSQAVQAIQSDALNRKITVQRSRIYLGELLEVVSRQAKVNHTVSNSRGMVDGHHLSVFVREQPLREVLDALCALFSHRHDAWEWRSDQRGGYVLYHQRSPDAAAAATRQSVLEKWSADVATYHRISRLPPAERSRQAASRPDLFPGLTLKSGIPELFGTLSPSQLQSLIRGAEVAIEPARLDDSARNALTFGMSGAQPEERQGEFRKSVPGFRVTWDPLGVGPILWIGNENGSELSVVGGTLWDSAWFREHGEGWRNSGYPLVQEHLKQRQSGAAGGPIAARSLADWVRLAATKQKVNILFDHTYPRGGQGAGGPWLGNTPEQTLSALVLSGGLTWKPHKAFHLLRDKTATIHPRRHLLPWSKIRTLRGTAERNDGYLSLVDLRGLGDLNWEQLAGLAEEFPDTSPDRLALWMPILEFYSHLDAGPAKRIITEAGVPLRETGLVARAALGDGPDPQGIRNLKLLQEHFREVIVSLRQETYRDKARTRVPHRPAMEQERRRLVWEAWTPPDGTRYRREFRLSPREPLLPE